MVQYLFKSTKTKKGKKKEMRTTRDHSAGLCWHNTVTTYFNYMNMQMEADKDTIHVRWFSLFWWTARFRQRNGKEFSTDLPVTKLADNLLPPYPSQDALQTKRGVKNTTRIHKKVKKTWSGIQTWSFFGIQGKNYHKAGTLHDCGLATKPQSSSRWKEAVK